MTPYDRLAQLGLTLMPAPPPVANFVTYAMGGGLLFLSGQGPRDARGQMRVGKVGADVSIEQAYDHARLTGLNLLSVLHEAVGDLGRVTRVVKLLGLVNGTSEFSDHPKVINGCSDLFVTVFGPTIGSHARSAVGVASLPGNITVEIEGIVEIRA